MSFMRIGLPTAVFLPRVAPEQGSGRDGLLDNLSLKAGPPANVWREVGASLSAIRTVVFSEAAHP